MLINYKNCKCLWTKWHCGQTVIDARLLYYLCNILVHAVTCVLSVSSRHFIYRSQSWSVWVAFTASLLYKATETWSTRLAGKGRNVNYRKAATVTGLSAAGWTQGQDLSCMVGTGEQGQGHGRTETVLSSYSSWQWGLLFQCNTRRTSKSCSETAWLIPGLYVYHCSISWKGNQ